MNWCVPPVWTGQTCVILAGGASLDRSAVQGLRGVRIIAINNSYLLRPDADILYFCDLKWWNRHSSRVRRAFRGHYIVTLDNQIKGVMSLRSAGRLGLSSDPGKLYHGSNSGYQALNLAYLLGVNRVVLFGYDCNACGAQSNWHSEEVPNKTPATYQRVIDQSGWVAAFNTLALMLKQAGVVVLNCSPGSSLRCWPIVTADIALCRPMQAQRFGSTVGASTSGSQNVA